MAYATAQDMIDRFGEQELIQLTDASLEAVQTAAVNRALADAQALVDGFVGRVFALPLPGCLKPAPTEGNPQATELVPPPQLTRITCDVARYFLHDDLVAEHEVSVRYKAAERQLQAIAEGKAIINCPWGGQPGVMLAGSAPGEAEVGYSFAPRRITDEALRGFE